MEISESINGGVVEPSYKNLLGKTPTVLVTIDKIEENPTRHRLTPQWLRVLTGAENDM